MKTDPRLKIIIHGEWPDVGSNGVFINEGPSAEVFRIGSKYIKVAFKDSEHNHRKATLELCPTPNSGFTRIVFITTH